ncbi:MAG: nucleoside 2-deoxyribosyltransferase [Lachnospiraceae bacterium]|nr:nucleoside 2-deoxyribosyltransferase [Lachnospiraceae bacterium]
MDKKRKRVFKDICEYFFIGIFVSIIASEAINFIENRKNIFSMYPAVWFIIVGLFIISLTIALVNNRRNIRKKNEDVLLVKEWIKYDRKRKEIDRQMNLLAKQLVHSDAATYLDINRLIFAGQKDIYQNDFINYGAFLKQFGIDVSKLKAKKNSALFLTPFTEEGEILFMKCHNYLREIDVFLQKTDVCVEKDDILMNIVSLIIQSEIIIVNINGRNPNVYYELGIAHALGKITILLSEDNNSLLDDIGFDIRQKRIIMYKSDEDLEKQLLYLISNIKRNRLDKNVI